MNKPMKPTKLVGQFFHTLSDKRKIEYQGMIIGNPEPGWYLVQIFDYLMGEPSIQKIYHISNMKDWLIYDSAEQMNFSFERGTARPGGPYRDLPRASQACAEAGFLKMKEAAS